MQLDVLVVDDEEGIRRSLSRVLRDEGYTVDGARDGEEALTLFRARPLGYDIVICDLIMPGIDGIRTIEEISKLGHDSTKIILTGYGTLEASIKAIDAGVDGFITKPFENRELKWKVRECHLRRKMKQFISPNIYEQILGNPALLETRLSYVTILFADIRGFTSLSLANSPGFIASLLNSDYFKPMSDLVMRHNGIVDKYIGDSIMALFGAPVSQPGHEEQAVTCAVEMVDTVTRMDKGFRIGVGISSGRVVTGLFGSTSKKEFTALGTAVNIAARLEKMARPGEILASESTAAKLDGLHPVVEGGTFRLTPLLAPVKYYTWSRNDTL